MQRRSLSFAVGFAALMAAIPSFSQAGTVDLRRDDVIPVVVQDELTFKNTESGDRFRAEVTDSRLLPYGTRVEGRVNRVQQKRGKEPAYMDIVFTAVILPDGSRTNIKATPIALNGNSVTRNSDGRWQAKKGYKKETVVLGTTAGGLILGSLIKKPFEGAIIGALAGIFVAETDKDHVGDGNVVIQKGAKIGALLDRDVRISWSGAWNDDGYGDYNRDGYNGSGYDRYGYDRDGNYNPRYDQGRDRNGDRDSDRYRNNPVRGDYNRDGYDRNGYDREGRYNSQYDDSRSDRYEQRSTNGRDIVIEADRRRLSYRNDELPYWKDGMVMVPLRATADQMDLRLREGDEIRLESDRDVITFNSYSRNYRLNDRKGTISADVEIRNGVTFVPIQVFSLLKKIVCTSTEPNSRGDF